ncbi:MAG: L,D-transpeptidase family protein [Pseudomonadota bacterium]
MKKSRNLQTLIVRRKPGQNRAAGILTFGDQSIECRLGKTGITAIKREGDGATPRGKFQILDGFFRRDRQKRPHSTIRLKQITTKMGWCDAPENANYNALVKLPFLPSHETMTRDDRLYNVCLVLDYNIKPVQRHFGSAIFFHLTSETNKGTQGCVAISPAAMRKLLPRLSLKTFVDIRL